MDRNEYQREWNKKNREKVLAYARAYNATHKEEKNLWNLKNKERIASTGRIYRKLHKENEQKRHKIYYETHLTERREWNLKNKKSLLEYQKNWTYKNVRTPIGRYKNSIRTARHKKFDWNISQSDYFELMSKGCNYCDGILPVVGIGLDRLDNSKGYVVGNIVPCCTSCNRIKNDQLTYDEMKIAMGAIKQYRLSKILVDVEGK